MITTEWLIEWGRIGDGSVKRGEVGRRGRHEETGERMGGKEMYWEGQLAK